MDERMNDAVIINVEGKKIAGEIIRTGEDGIVIVKLTNGELIKTTGDALIRRETQTLDKAVTITNRELLSIGRQLEDEIADETGDLDRLRDTEFNAYSVAVSLAIDTLYYYLFNEVPPKEDVTL
ncbi:hypothetical protein [Sharpea azabuensis]|uniref:hypothetical protein n=1 Tax=Sharpea azabuensis TaxID=322505 RepID=UPI001568CCCA|nr:hypothetical protein [Sharpea azabuensis]